jgi:sugar lactone lactonase YvrE
MSATIRRLSPSAVIPGGRLTLDGEGFSVSPGHLPSVTIGGTPVRLARASSTSLVAHVPDDVPGGLQAVAVEGVEGATAFVSVGTVITTGVHQVDSPAFDKEGRLYATLSGGRGQDTPVSVFRIERDGTREAFVSGIANATSLAFDTHGVLHVSSRFEGAVYTVDADGTCTQRADELGVACGLAFGADGALYVGDRSGTIFRLPAGATDPDAFATLPGSIAAFHLAMSPDGVLHVTAPTLNSCDAVYRVLPDGTTTRWAEGFGRPQGLAFDPAGRLHVVDALAGNSGLYRLTEDGRRDLVVSGQGLIGVAFDPLGGFVVCTADTIYGFA